MVHSRIPLIFSEGRVILTVVVSCSALRIAPRMIDFVIDTGSPDSFLSQKDALVLQVPLKSKPSIGIVDFGGSRYQQIVLPKFTFHMLEEGIQPLKTIKRNVQISALRSNKQNPEKVLTGQSLPSILGIDFLKLQKFSLHVLPAENLAYLELENGNTAK